MTRVLRSGARIQFKSAPSIDRFENRYMLSMLISTSNPGLLVAQSTIQIADVTVAPPSGGSVPTAIFYPAQMRVAYGLNQVSDEGQGETVAIVDAYSQPDIALDLSVFSSRFGLPQLDGLSGDPTLSIKVPTGQLAPADADASWSLEISMDVEWVHAIAPYANIDLVTCQNDTYDSLFAAEVDGEPYSSGAVYAASLPGVVVVSDSWGGPEFAAENRYNSEFTSRPDVAYTFATGDRGEPGYFPAYSPDVVAVGGTSLTTLSVRGTYGYESGWSGESGVSGSGGGVSLYEPTPAYQSGAGVDFGKRSIPDISMDTNPNTGVFVYDTDLSSGFTEMGGTSLSCPMWAGLIAIADQGAVPPARLVASPSSTPFTARMIRPATAPIFTM